MHRRLALALAAVVVAGSPFALIATSGSAAASPEALWSTSATPATITDADTGSVELGTKFTAAVSGQVVGVRFYKGPKNLGTHTVNLWSSAGALLRSHTVAGESASGWQTQLFGTAQPVAAGQSFTASYLAPKGHYSDNTGYFTAPLVSGDLTAPTNAGVYTYGSTDKFPVSVYQASNYWVTPLFVPDASPSPTPSPTVTPTPSPTPTPSATPTPSPTPTVTPSPTPSSTGFPDGSNTGVPAGTVLTPYSGPITGTLDGVKLVGDFAVSGSANIVNSEIDGSIKTTGSGSLTLTDDTINGLADDEDVSVIFGSNITALRVNVSGGKANFQGAGNDSITDSWLHDPYIESPYHYDMIGSNGINGFTIRHNTISCTNHAHAANIGAAGCSADMGFFGDFDVIQNVTVDHNLFVASNDSAGYCVITNANKPGKANPVGRNLIYTNNVWQKGANGRCGQFGPVDEWQAGNGNVWSGNTWDDGTALNE